MTPASAGSWRYPSAPKTHWTFALAIVGAVSLHAALFYGFESKPVGVGALRVFPLTRKRREEFTCEAKTPGAHRENRGRNCEDPVT